LNPCGKGDNAPTEVTHDRCGPNDRHPGSHRLALAAALGTAEQLPTSVGPSRTYLLSGVLLAITAVMFNAGILNAITQTIAWCIIFFFASAGASAAYLTVSEIFPLEVRAQAIAVFFAIAQCFGAIGPIFYGWLIGEGGDPFKLFIGYLIGAGVMMVGGIVEVVLGVDAEGKSLEHVAPPLSAVSATRSRATG
jgi:MFS family permease